MPLASCVVVGALHTFSELCGRWRAVCGRWQAMWVFERCLGGVACVGPSVKKSGVGAVAHRTGRIPEGQSWRSLAGSAAEGELFIILQSGGPPPTKLR